MSMSVRVAFLFLLALAVRTLHTQEAWTETLESKDFFFGIDFLDAETGYAVSGNQHVFKTVDSGKTWTRSETGMAWTRLACFHNRDTGWVSGAYASNIARTVDGGKTWRVSSASLGGVFNSDVFFLGARLGWAVGSGGTVSKSTDGGATWSPMPPAPSRFLWTVRFLSADTGWAGGRGGVFKSTDGGTTWTVSSPAPAEVWGLRFLDAKNGWVVGSQGGILKTSDGGANWIPQASGVTNDLHGVDFSGPDTGWVVGNSVILKTTDGGNHWTPQTVPSARLNLWTVDLAGGQGWMAGHNLSGEGLVLKRSRTPVGVARRPGRFQSGIEPIPGKSFDLLGRPSRPYLPFRFSR